MIDWDICEAIALAAASADIEITAGGIRKIASALGPEIARREALARREGAELALREAGYVIESGMPDHWINPTAARENCEIYLPALLAREAKS